MAFRETAQAAKRGHPMTATHFDIRLLDQARKEIGDLIDARGDAVIAGIAADYPDYRYRCGEIAGFTSALNIMTEIVRKMGDNRPS
jgi:hypothetical protein